VRLTIAPSRRALFAGVAAAICLIVSGESAQASRPLTTGFAESRYQSADAPVRAEAFDQTIQAKAGLVLLNVSWRSITSGTPANASSPADPAYNFANVDAAVRDASARGLTVVLAPTQAPAFAEGSGRPANADPGAWRPDPGQFGQFAIALAARYSGSFTPAGSGAPLPRVKYFQAWTEPNLANHLAPQYDSDGSSVGPGLYRSLLNAAYAGIHQVHGDNVVITGATGPYGDTAGPNVGRTRPVAFWREVLCVAGRKALKPKPCPVKANFDIFAHNPINTSGGPRRSAVHPDDASTPDLKNLVKVLGASEKHHLTGTGGRHPVWATEIWWESSPPDKTQGVPLGTQARYIEEALYVLYKQGARVVVNLQLRDTPTKPQPMGETATGILFKNGSPKPSYTAFRFPFVADRKGKDRILAWGRAPVSGKLVIERRDHGHWRRAASLHVSASQVFRRRLPARGTSVLRARVGDERSLPWRRG
jgi:hypothetical protein